MRKMNKKYKIGVISDTHGLLRPGVQMAFQGVDMILHAGDVGGMDILRSLEKIAPVTAVCGNMDNGALENLLSETELIRVGDVSIYMRHDILLLDRKPEASGIQIVVSGHTHSPFLKTHGDVTYLNPGSAGPRRYRLPVTVAILEIEGNRISAKHVEIEA